MTEKQEEMLQQMIYLYNLFLNEVGEAIENLRQVKTRDWPARVYKDDVDKLKSCVRVSRSKLSTSRKMIDAVIESEEIYREVFPFEKSAISSQQSAPQPQPKEVYSGKVDEVHPVLTALLAHLEGLATEQDFEHWLARIQTLTLE